MKEININIEGYNVNGICVGCLNYNRKMFYADEVKECFKMLADIDVPDGLTVQVCWECLAYVRSAIRFRTQILHSFDILMDYSRQHTFLNSPRDLCSDAPQRLRSVTLATEDMVHQHTYTDTLEVEVAVDVKQEPKDEDDTHEYTEAETIKSESEYMATGAALSQGAASSEEDLQLSELKKKKKKTKKKRREKTDKSKVERTGRKLKNLPPELVELHTMTEEEMWLVRAADVAGADFAQLKYKCSDCVLAFSSARLLRSHVQGKHRPKSADCQQCDVCKAYFLTRDNVSSHRALHAQAFRCVECGLKTTLKRVMAKHALQHRGGGYACEQCHEEFSTKSKLAYHKGVCHQERPQCDCCGKVFANKMTLKYHLKVLPQNKDEKPKEKLYITCKGCNKVFHTKKSYRAHVVIHNGLTYPCPICGKLFQWKRNLARHTRNHRDRDLGATHECRECGKTFSSRDCYNNHMKLSKRHVHEDTYSHECSYCGKKFATKWCMVDHVDWDHLKRIKYQCSVCFKAFKTAKIMVAHMNNIHEGKRSKEPEGEHLCEICGKSYKTVKRLKGHVWAMHTSRAAPRSFKCALCPATFTWQTSIYKHMKMMHDANKRQKQVRPPPQKKQVQYPGIEYFHQNIASNLVQNIAQGAQPPPGALL